jgi:transcriptional regulator with XRE-family HTH domain
MDRLEPQDLRTSLVFLMAASGKSREELAAASGIGEALVARYERGTAKLSEKSLLHLAKAMDVKLSGLEGIVAGFRGLRLAVADMAAPEAAAGLPEVIPQMARTMGEFLGLFRSILPRAGTRPAK